MGSSFHISYTLRYVIFQFHPKIIELSVVLRLHLFYLLNDFRLENDLTYTFLWYILMKCAEFLDLYDSLEIILNSSTNDKRSFTFNLEFYHAWPISLKWTNCFYLSTHIFCHIFEPCHFYFYLHIPSTLETHALAIQLPQSSILPTLGRFFRHPSLITLKQAAHAHTHTRIHIYVCVYNARIRATRRGLSQTYSYLDTESEALDSRALSWFKYTHTHSVV